MKKVSIKDIAKKAGVSTATVSRVLNDRGGYTEETAIRVRNIINQTGYTVNLSAKELRTKISNSVGVIVPDITNEYFAAIARVLDTYFLNKGYSTIIADSNENPQQEIVRLNDMIHKNVDGVIFIAAQKTSIAVKNYPKPIVHVDRTIKDAEYCVLSDNTKGGELAAKELVQKGCKHIILVRDQHRTSPIVQREQGFSSWIARNTEDVTIMDITCLPNYDQAMRALREAFKNDNAFDGVFASNDLIAVITVNLLKELGISVPGEVKVVGFDDTMIARFSYPSITTIRQNTDKIAREAAEMLYRLMKNEIVTERERIIPVELIVRESTSAIKKAEGGRSGTIS